MLHRDYYETEESFYFGLIDAMVTIVVIVVGLAIVGLVTFLAITIFNEGGRKMVKLLKKLFGHKTAGEGLKAIRLRVLPDQCRYSKGGKPGPSVVIDGENIIIYPQGVEMFPTTYVRESANVDIANGQMVRRLGTVDVEFIWHDPKDDEYRLGRASRFLDEDEEYKWEIEYYNR